MKKGKKKEKKKNRDVGYIYENLPLWARILFFIIIVMVFVVLCLRNVSGYDFHW
jgi:hypothetical protein